MGERKGQNHYYPPDWRPEMGNLNKYHGTHALRERARKIHQGIIIIRFEMPYNIWCDGCKNHIGMGVRYNAEKTKVGMYYTTPIYQFKMKCHLCNNHFEIKTDPQHFDYVIVSGARRQENRWDPKDNEQIVPEDKEDSKKLLTDAMFRLEHGADDLGKSKAAAPVLAKLEDVRTRWKDDYESNKVLRKIFRDKKKEILVKSEKDNELLKKSSLNIKLVEEDPQDVKLAGLLKLASTYSVQEVQKQKRDSIQSRPLFDFKKSSTSTSPTVSIPTTTILVGNATKQLADVVKKSAYRNQMLVNPKTLSSVDLGIVASTSTSTSGNSRVSSSSAENSTNLQNSTPKSRRNSVNSPDRVHLNTDDDCNVSSSNIDETRKSVWKALVDYGESDSN